VCVCVCVCVCVWYGLLSIILSRAHVCDGVLQQNTIASNVQVQIYVKKAIIWLRSTIFLCVGCSYITLFMVILMVGQLWSHIFQSWIPMPRLFSGGTNFLSYPVWLRFSLIHCFSSSFQYGRYALSPSACIECSYFSYFSSQLAFFIMYCSSW